MTDFERLVGGLQRHIQQNSGLSSVAFGMDPETRRFWKANAGNAKARRRWRRKDIPNTQRAWAQVEVVGVDMAGAQ